MFRSTGVFISCFILAVAPVFAQTGNLIEQNGVVVVEAESFTSQHQDDQRRWLKISKDNLTTNYQDADTAHIQNASNGAYIEILPDTRVNHHDTLIQGENFTDEAGKVAVITYPIYFSTPGKYYLWARAYSSGSEDNGVHFGLNGNWPDSAKRLQLCEGKYQWTWSSAQRVPENHCGTPNTITLTIPHAGVHTVMVSMREDGFELDKFILTQDKNYRPDGIDTPETRSAVKALAVKTMLYNIENYVRIFHPLDDFSFSKSNWLVGSKEQHIVGINTERATLEEYIIAETMVNKKDRDATKLVLVTIADGIGKSAYQLWLNGKKIASFESSENNTKGEEEYFTVGGLDLKEDDKLTVKFKALPTTSDGKTVYSKALWRALVMGR